MSSFIALFGFSAILLPDASGSFDFSREDLVAGSEAVTKVWDDIANLAEYGTTTYSRETWLKNAGDLLDKAMPGYPWVISINGLGPSTGCIGYHNDKPPFDVVIGNLQLWLPCRVEHHTDGGFLNWRYMNSPLRSYWIRRDLKDIFGYDYVELTLSLDVEEVEY